MNQKEYIKIILVVVIIIVLAGLASYFVFGQIQSNSQVKILDTSDLLQVNQTNTDQINNSTTQVGNEISNTNNSQENTSTKNETSPPGNASICGRVWYIPGAEGFEPGPVKDDIVKIYKSEQLVTTSITNDKGEFRIDNLQQGEYVAIEQSFSQKYSSIKAVSGQCVKIEIVVAAPSRN